MTWNTEADRFKVSVVIPTYNTGPTVLTGLRALREQTMPREDFEVIYVDDGSTDDTAAILERELAGEPNARLIRIENSGWPGRPRNIGTEAARGAYVHYVDDDDWLAPEALERLYARARDTDADIVIGRMAGHGRGAPRAVFNKPLARANLREHHVLLGSMTVHKLFRRAFLAEQELRFPEGKVRLEDHIFMLRAYLRTDRVATVHDYTTYHWVRHRNGQHNISYQRIDPGPYVDSIRRVLAVLDEPESGIPHGPLRNRLLANWYGYKGLRRLTGRGLLIQPAEHRYAWFDAVSALASDLPQEADSYLPARLRVVSALARHGDRDAWEDFAVFEAGISYEHEVTSTEWHDGRLTVRCRAQLVHSAFAGAPAKPVVFTRRDGRYRWELPAGVMAVPGVAGAADFTGEAEDGKARGLVHHKEGGTVLGVRSSHHFTAVPLGTPAADAGATASARVPAPRGPLARLTRRLRGAHAPAHPEERCALRYETEFTVDPATADQGAPLAPGVWHLKVQANSCGWLAAPRLRGLSVNGVEDGPENGLEDAAAATEAIDANAADRSDGPAVKGAVDA
ncbi:glycosyltransferase [Streptomyces boncukensis]|uniref:Glycosyltransferase family 2 protein n=1 Tax=Streptomyces boncukensis TaxID=2711219 RepID=A0A6G4X480_9ACTN|nr:glycosyltransferase family 2 protein [Streptomyces boncukensis]